MVLSHYSEWKTNHADVKLWRQEICKSLSLSRQQALSSVCETKLQRCDSESRWCSRSLSLPVSRVSCVQCPRWSLESRIWLPKGRRVSRTTSRVTFYSKRWRLVNLINRPHSFNLGKVTFVKNVHIWSADLGENALLVTSPPGGYLFQNRPDFLGNGDIFCHLNDMSHVVTGGCVCFRGRGPSWYLKNKPPRCMRQHETQGIVSRA